MKLDNTSNCSTHDPTSHVLLKTPINYDRLADDYNCTLEASENLLLFMDALEYFRLGTYIQTSVQHLHPNLYDYIK